jgi:hypothetical protein
MARLHINTVLTAFIFVAALFFYAGFLLSNSISGSSDVHSRADAALENSDFKTRSNADILPPADAGKDLPSNSVAVNDPVSNSVAVKEPVSNSVAVKDSVSNSVAVKGPVSNSVAVKEPVSNSVAVNDPVSNSVAVNDPVSNSDRVYTFSGRPAPIPTDGYFQSHGAECPSSSAKRFPSTKVSKECAWILELDAHKGLGYSAHHQDAIVETIFNQIGRTNKFFVEFGFGNGNFNTEEDLRRATLNCKLRALPKDF